MDLDLNVFTSKVPRTLLQILTVPDVAVSWKWGVMLPTNIPEPIPADSSNTGITSGNSIWRTIEETADKISNVVSNVANQVNVAAICLRAESIKIPFESLTSTTVRTQARLRSFPNEINVESVDMTFYEDYNYTTLTYLEKWKRSIVNERGVFRLPEGEDGYCRDIYAYLFDTVGLLKGAVKFVNCYPEQIQALNLGSSSEAVKISCSFSVQAISWTPQKFLNLGALGSTGKTILQGITSGQYGSTLGAGIKGIGSLF